MHQHHFQYPRLRAFFVRASRSASAIRCAVVVSVPAMRDPLETLRAT
jgi:hypothetical protein